MVQQHTGVSFLSLAGAVDDFGAGDSGSAGGDAQAPKPRWSVLPDNVGNHLPPWEMLWGQAPSGLTGAGASSQGNTCPMF